MSQNIPEAFDWVAERAKCTPFRIFESLRQQVREDMEKRNRLSAETGIVPISYLFQEEARWFAVVRLGTYGHVLSGVLFSLTPDGITVADAVSRDVICNAALTISDDGNCRLKVGANEYNLWQFRKLALQELFFVNREGINP